MDRGAWQATVHGVAKSQTHLSKHFHLGCFHFIVVVDFFLAAPRGMRNLSSPIRDGTHVPGIKRQILNQWMTGKSSDSCDLA